MLMLTRRLGETVMIGDDIEVIVLGIEETRVRLGFKAPPDVEVYRDELYRRIHGLTAERQHERTRTPSEQLRG